MVSLLALLLGASQSNLQGLIKWLQHPGPRLAGKMPDSFTTHPAIPAFANTQSAPQIGMNR
jgi:hypothetical protein